jgi:hypothetical protein
VVSPARVHLRISPSNAVVIVDGAVLPRGTDTIVRPQDTTTIQVLVRADKHDDTIVLVDSATPDDVEVTLTPNTRPVLAVTATTSQAGTGTSTTGTGQGPKVVKNSAGASGSAKDAGAGSGPPLDAPPNPYD